MDSSDQRLLRAATASLDAFAQVPLEAWARALTEGRPAPGMGAGLTLDASFALRGDATPSARGSVNDRGDPDGFREALRELAPTMGLSRGALDRFLAVSAAGEVQTTLGVKWARPGPPSRITLYFEELTQSPWPHRVVQGVASLARCAPPPDPAPMAVALDFRPGEDEPMAFKLYSAAVDRPGRPDPRGLPGALAAFRARLPYHRGVRRMLWSTRGGDRVEGRKGIWVPEVRHSGDVDAVWDVVDTLRAAMSLPPSPPAAALDSLGRDPDLYPDLVSLDTDGDGVPVGLTVYVATRSPKNRRASSM